MYTLEISLPYFIVERDIVLQMLNAAHTDSEDVRLQKVNAI